MTPKAENAELWAVVCVDGNYILEMTEADARAFAVAYNWGGRLYRLNATEIDLTNNAPQRDD